MLEELQSAGVIVLMITIWLLCLSLIGADPDEVPKMPDYYGAWLAKLIIAIGLAVGLILTFYPYSIFK